MPSGWQAKTKHEYWKAWLRDQGKNFEPKTGISLNLDLDSFGVQAESITVCRCER